MRRKPFIWNILQGTRGTQSLNNAVLFGYWHKSQIIHEYVIAIHYALIISY